MKIIVITFNTDLTNPGYIHLTNSLEKHGYDFYCFIGEGGFSWGGDNYTPMLPKLREFIEQGYTHILYTDAWDTLAMSGPNELIDKYLSIYEPLTSLGNYWLYSAEKNPCFCIDEARYPAEGRWKYLCAGNFITPIKLFIDKVEHNKRQEGENDQEWGSKNYIHDNHGFILLDNDCEIFQTMYNMGDFHVPPNSKEFALSDEYRLVNLITATKPVFVHGNGKVDMRCIYHPHSDHGMR